MDCLYLHLRRVIGNRSLAHQCKLNGFPVIRLPLLCRIPCQLKLPELSQEVEIMAVEDNLHICVFCNIIHILGGNVGPV